MEYAASLQSVKEAAERISPYAHVTPVLTCNTIDKTCGLQCYFKCEVFQKGGAFKFRGACNAVMSLPDDQLATGVVTHSSGNHAAAVALAAQLKGVPAYIVVPEDTPSCKVEAVRTYGGQLTFCAPTMDARQQTCDELQQQTGATFIAPYNYGPVISGQGTIALELLQQVPELDCIIVPVSGGGMISGIALAAKGIKPGIKVVAAEPTGSNDAADIAAAKAAGEIVACPKPKTIADGLQGRLGDLTWPIIRDFVDGVVTISEGEIVGAMQLVMERMKVVVEPSGAAGLAAALSPQFAQQFGGCQKVGIILCGGNLDFGGKGFWGMWGV